MIFRPVRSIIVIPYSGTWMPPLMFFAPSALAPGKDSSPTFPITFTVGIKLNTVSEPLSIVSIPAVQFDYVRIVIMYYAGHFPCFK